jgi:hypothetical protein
MALVVRASDVKLRASLTVGMTTNVIELEETRCTVEGCTNGACSVGMVLQQS